jgi:hypothetical protein
MTSRSKILMLYDSLTDLHGHQKCCVGYAQPFIQEENYILNTSVLLVTDSDLRTD